MPPCGCSPLHDRLLHLPRDGQGKVDLPVVIARHVRHGAADTRYHGATRLGRAGAPPAASLTRGGCGGLRPSRSSKERTRRAGRRGLRPRGARRQGRRPRARAPLPAPLTAIKSCSACQLLDVQVIALDKAAVDRGAASGAPPPANARVPVCRSRARGLRPWLGPWSDRCGSILCINQSRPSGANYMLSWGRKGHGARVKKA